MPKPGKISLNKHIASGANICHNNNYMFVSLNFAWYCQRIFLTRVPFFHKLLLENVPCIYCSIMFTGAIKLHKPVHRCVCPIPRILLVPICIGCHVKQSSQDQSKSAYSRNSTFPRCMVLNNVKLLCLFSK